MVEEFGPVGGVADHEVFGFAETIDENIVFAATLFVADEGVADLAVGHAVNLAGADAVEEEAGIFAGEAEAAHVGDIEHAPGPADLFVFFDDRAVMERHVPADEGDHFGVVGQVEIVEWGVGESRGCGCGGHVSSVAIHAFFCQCSVIFFLAQFFHF